MKHLEQGDQAETKRLARGADEGVDLVNEGIEARGGYLTPR
jgi:hypothetical protein